MNGRTAGRLAWGIAFACFAMAAPALVLLYLDRMTIDSFNSSNVFGLVAAVTFGVLITVGLWWTYFDRFAGIAEERLRDHQDPVLAAADAYSYLHLVIVAGIIVFAVGAKIVVHEASDPLGDAARLALCGGVALYLLGHVAFRLRMIGDVGWEKLAVGEGQACRHAIGIELGLGGERRAEGALGHAQ